MTSKKIKVDKAMLTHAFSNQYYRRQEILPYSDKISGKTIWVYYHDEDAELNGESSVKNKQYRKQIEKKSSRYLLITGTHKSDHRAILLAFLNSNWTNDNSQKELVSGYYNGSVSNWIKSVRTKLNAINETTSVIDLWQRYEFQAIDEMMEKFFFGVAPSMSG